MTVDYGGSLVWKYGNISHNFVTGDIDLKWSGIVSAMTTGSLKLEEVVLSGNHVELGSLLFFQNPSVEVSACVFANNDLAAGVADIHYTAISPSETEALVLQDNHFDRTGGVVVGLPRSCADTAAIDGVIMTYPAWKEKIELRCVLCSPGAPWTTFQRRVDTTSFDRDWDAYKTGFSNAERERTAASGWATTTSTS